MQKNDTLEDLVTLISINSEGKNHSSILGFISQELKKYKHKIYTSDCQTTVYIKGERNDTALIFNSHIDTVEAGNRALWQTDPLKGVIKGNKVFGLGASDEKASVAVLMSMVKKYSLKKPPIDLFLSFVGMEETDGNGTQEFLKWFKNYDQHKNKSAVICEPTGLNSLQTGHKGNYFITITTTGDSGHASEPDKIKNNAVMKMLSIGKNLELLGKIWKKKYTDKVFGSPSIALFTTLKTDNLTSPNKISGICTATFNVRTTPQLHENLEQQVTDRIGEKGVYISFVSGVYGKTNPKAPIVKIVQSITNGKIEVANWANDLSFFANEGIDAVVFGPGEKSAIHKENEYCNIDDLSECLKLYEEIVNKYSLI